jgi:DNA polymerase-4
MSSSAPFPIPRPRPRRILHLDVDAFLASVEQALHPELAGRPVVVGGMPNERNLIMSCSYEARAFGLRPGMRLAEAARRCPDAVFRRGDSQAANRLREQTALLLMGTSPIVEVASIDDFFVDLTGCERRLRDEGGAFATAERLRTEIRREVGLPVTVGIGTSRMLARLAGKLAKPGGVGEILPGYEADFLAALPVRELPGVGHSIGAALERFAIRTVRDLRCVSREVLFASFGRPGLLVHERARGIDSEPVEATYVEDSGGALRMRIPATIRRDSTFEPEEGRREIALAMLSYVVERAAARLRFHGANASSIEVRVRYVDTRTRIDSPGPAGASAPVLECRQPLPTPTDSTDELWQHARALFHAIPRRRALFKRVGLTLFGLRARPGWQGRLFSDPIGDRPGHPGSGHHGPGSRADRQRTLDRALDALRAKHGFGRLLRGTSLPLAKTHELGPDGFRLRTPSLNQ